MTLADRQIGHVTGTRVYGIGPAGARPRARLRYPVRQVGGRDLLELWVPAEEPSEFNQRIVGLSPGAFSR
ncbi:hypothetical protein DLJ46_19910 [Micromonospora globispora]|uniref:Uncharacterized protein n=1 Tax=Micromonospora globispora TaxID=1450148 RepID=A0A317JZZ1_9ACTN|nr:hypothetical protein DLJ46_19910 [Micromonospora globispora]